MKRFSPLWLALSLILSLNASAEVITSLPDGAGRVVALTFDACESTKPAHFDPKVLDFLVSEKIPFTVFVTGKFVKSNSDEVKKLSELDFVEIENHSFSHYSRMEKLKAEKFAAEVNETGELILGLTGRSARFFRFPAGNYDSKTLEKVEAMGYKVVHWTFPSGDPDKDIDAEELLKWVLENTKPGSILIFHINGRGHATGEALPKIVADLKKKNYGFALLRDALSDNEETPPAAHAAVPASAAIENGAVN